jgi:hypothetical protein
MGNGDIVPLFLTSELEVSEWSASRPGRFTPGERDDHKILGVRFLTGLRYFSFLYSAQTGHGPHWASYTMRKGGSIRVNKAAGTWSWPFTAIRSRGLECVVPYLHSPSHVFISWCLTTRSYRFFLLPFKFRKCVKVLMNCHFIFTVSNIGFINLFI